jgi:hypothetical protein
MSRHHRDLPADAVLVEDLSAEPHGGEIGLAAHHDADARTAHRFAPAVRVAMSERDHIPAKWTRSRFS